MASPPLIIVDGFLPAEVALQMRRGIDEHFADPQLHQPETHQVWNYWFVPELYTYLRANPEKVIGPECAAAFHDALRRWSIATLGMANVSWPFLSLYVPGCRQGWHNDSRNGRFGFVYSLTRDPRRTLGGETLVRREADPFRANLTQPQAGRGFYETIEPRFNRLLIFDDRLPHAVERLEGAMDPVEGRFVLHGHVSEGGPIVEARCRPRASADRSTTCCAAFARKPPPRSGSTTGPWSCACGSLRRAASPVAMSCSTESCIPTRVTPIGTGFATGSSNGFARQNFQPARPRRC
jgi:hypothetical protein